MEGGGRRHGLCFGAGAFDAQEFVGNCGFVSVIEADEEFSPIFLEAQLGEGAACRPPLLGRADVAGFVAQHHGDAIADGEGGRRRGSPVRSLRAVVGERQRVTGRAKISSSRGSTPGSFAASGPALLVFNSDAVFAAELIGRIRHPDPDAPSVADVSAAHLSSSVRASKSACFSGFVKGQPAESELITGASSTAVQSAFMAPRSR